MARTLSWIARVDALPALDLPEPDPLARACAAPSGAPSGTGSAVAPDKDGLEDAHDAHLAPIGCYIFGIPFCYKLRPASPSSARRRSG